MHATQALADLPKNINPLPTERGPNADERGAHPPHAAVGGGAINAADADDNHVARRGMRVEEAAEGPHVAEGERVERDARHASHTVITELRTSGSTIITIIVLQDEARAERVSSRQEADGAGPTIDSRGGPQGGDQGLELRRVRIRRGLDAPRQAPHGAAGGAGFARKLLLGGIAHRNEVRREGGPVVRGRRLTRDIGTAQVELHSESGGGVGVSVRSPSGSGSGAGGAPCALDRRPASRDAAVALGGLGGRARDGDDEGFPPRRRRRVAQQDRAYMRQVLVQRYGAVAERIQARAVIFRERRDRRRRRWRRRRGDAGGRRGTVRVRVKERVLVYRGIVGEPLEQTCPGCHGPCVGTREKGLEILERRCPGACRVQHRGREKEGRGQFAAHYVH